MCNETGQIGETKLSLTTEDVVSRILGFTRCCSVHATDRIDLVALSRGWIDGDGNPTEDGHALIRALMSLDGAYGIYQLLN
jgi:hypothetical protein